MPETNAYVCRSCGSLDIGKTNLEMFDLPPHVALLVSEIPKWKANWTAALVAHYEEAYNRAEPVTEMMEVAQRLVAHKTKYANYSMAFQSWWSKHLRDQKERRQKQPVKGGRY